jgi:hypothetical protein
VACATRHGTAPVALPPNFGVKLSRPGFGPPAEPAAFSASVTASRRLRFASRGFATPRPQPPRRSGFGTWALAVQLTPRTLAAPDTTQRGCTGVRTAAPVCALVSLAVVRDRGHGGCG